MSWLRGWWGTLRARLSKTRVLVAEGRSSLLACTHPAKALTACTYQLGPKGKYGWFYRCRACLGWFAC